MLTPAQRKQVDDIIRKEQEAEDNLVCPRCHGPRTDHTRRFCAPCVLHRQIDKNRRGLMPDQYMPGGKFYTKSK